MTSTSFHTEDLSKSTFLITGGAGFIGSHLVEYLVNNNAGRVVVVDNLSTGNIDNIYSFIHNSGVEFHQIDINDFEFLKEILSGVDFVLHQAALGSVPRSISEPLATHAANATGFLSVLEACRLCNVKRLVYASSSSVYGDSPELPKVEEKIGKPKSPYAVTKLMDEAYAKLYADMHGLSVTGLRYFNIFGPRQNPNGPYAAAIPLFIIESLKDGKPKVFGDGEQSRDFTYVENAVQANIKALFSENKVAGEVFNIACGERFSLNTILNFISEISSRKLDTSYEAERKGDIKDSHASIQKATELINYIPEVKLKEGLRITWKWYQEKYNS